MSTQQENLTAIADAIREKDGTTAPIPANEFPARIRAIETGGLPDDIRIITLETAPPEFGSVSGGGTASVGMVITVKAVPEGGYQFEGWKEDDKIVSTDAGYMFTVENDRILTAVFDETWTGRLPRGYIELEYIRVDSYCQVDTGVPVNFKKTRVVMDALFAESIGNVFGVADSGAGYFFISRNSLTTISYRWLTGSLVNKNMNLTNARVLIDWNVVTGTLKIGSSSYNTGVASSEIVSSKSIKLLSLEKTGYSAKMDLYSCQIYEGDTIVRDFVPCTDPDGAVGLYDLVGKKFFGNEWSGRFTAGPVI